MSERWFQPISPEVMVELKESLLVDYGWDGDYVDFLRACGFFVAAVAEQETERMTLAADLARVRGVRTEHLGRLSGLRRRAEADRNGFYGSETSAEKAYYDAERRYHRELAPGLQEEEARLTQSIEIIDGQIGVLREHCREALGFELPATERFRAAISKGQAN